MENIYEKLFENTTSFSLNVGDLLKVPLILLLLGNIFYSVMLVLKIKIMIDTIESESNSKIKALVYINLLISVVVGIFATLIILLG